MKYQGADLVRVTSHDEFRAGMTIFFNCACGKFHGAILVGRSPKFPCRWNRKCRAVGWRVAGCHVIERETINGHSFCLKCSLGHGHIYRLQEPPAEANDYDVVAAPTKAKERTR